VSTKRFGEPHRRASESARDQVDLTDRLSGDMSALDDFARELGGRATGDSAGVNATEFLPRRIDANEDTIEKDLAKLVLALVDLVRQLMERQAARRVNGGSLSDDEVERMGLTFLKLDRKMVELKAAFGLEGEDLNLNLGPIRNLL
jgi:hypothetical protein